MSETSVQQRPQLLRLHEARALPRKRVEELRLHVLELLHCGQDAKTACEEAGIMPSVLSRWLASDTNFAREVELARARRVFWVEEALYSTALGGSVTAQLQYLRTLRPDKWNRRPILPRTHKHNSTQKDAEQSGTCAEKEKVKPRKKVSVTPLPAASIRVEWKRMPAPAHRRAKPRSQRRVRSQRERSLRRLTQELPPGRGGDLLIFHKKIREDRRLGMCHACAG